MHTPPLPGHVPTIRVRGYCERTHQPYDFIFENWGHERQSGLPQWYLRRAERTTNTPPATSSRPGWLNRLIASCEPDEPPSPAVKGRFYVGNDYSGCPFCRNGGFVRCGGCGSLMCWSGTTGDYRVCSMCGEGAQVGNNLSSLDGAVDRPSTRKSLASPAMRSLEEL